MRRIVMIAAASALACGGEAPVSAPKTTAAVEASLDGSYGLTTVNSRILPQTIGFDGIGSVDALSGVIQLLPAAHFMDILITRRRGSGGIEIQADTVRGEYLRAGRTLLFMPEHDGEPYFFDVNEGKLTAFWPAFTIVYTKH